MSKEQPAPHVITSYERGLITQLCPAIQARKLIRFWYDDTTNDFQGWRLVEPHLIGQTKYKSANIWLVAWFLATPEQTMLGHEAKWGNYILDDIKELEVLDETYRLPRPLYNSMDKRMIKIFCAT